jgi:putative CocE/NonD family hydrolase
MNVFLGLALLATTVGLADAAPAGSPFPDSGVMPPQKASIRQTSQFLPMRDGVSLAMQIVLPSEAPAGVRMPSIVRFTRYGRMGGNTVQVSGSDAFWDVRKYAVIAVDQRGTGSSFGRVQYGKPELDDMNTVINWVVAQPWSNGRVAAIGTSYEGTTAELLAATGNPAVRAVAPLYSDYDYFSLFRPGGILNVGLAQGFSEITAAMDAGGVASPVDGDTGNARVTAAVAEHRANPNLANALRGAEFADDIAPGFTVPEVEMAPVGLQQALALARVPELHVTSWYDAAVAQDVLVRYATVAVPQRVVIGATNHGGSISVNPYRAPGPNTDGALPLQHRLAAQFFAPYLLDAAPPGPPQNSITYFTAGENVWHSTAVWPPAGFASRTLQLTHDNRLGTKADALDGHAALPVVTTGPHNRWFSQMTGEEVSLTDIASGAATAPAYTSDPLPSTIEITGTPVLRLGMTASVGDPSLFAYLLAVAPDGSVTDLTQGELRLVHRKLSPSLPALHSFLRRDAQLVAPGTPLDVPIALLPFSATVPKGYRLRLALAAGELPAFATVGAYTATIRASSHLDVPMRERPDLDAAR